MDWRDQRVTVMGLGHFGGGVAAARWLARQGARVTVTDLADEQVLADSLAELAGEPIAACHLGGHREEDFRAPDCVVVNPAVRPGNPFVEIARKAGARITTEIEMFIWACPARIVGVTGSNGKSTTAAMTAAILRAAAEGNGVGAPLCKAGHRPKVGRGPLRPMSPDPFSQARVWLGGNLGGSLLERLDEMSPGDWTVLELSSSQLWYMDRETPMPHVAVVTNCTPNHLDWHGRFEDYVAAKQRVLAGQTPEDFAVLNTLDPEVRSWGGACGTTAFGGAKVARPPSAVEESAQPGAAVPHAARLVPLWPEGKIPELRVPGEHNRVNAACAAAAAFAAGCDEEAIRAGLAGFTALPQRLELVAVVGGRRFCNDSSATTPESTVAALRSVQGRVWLLAGGRDKGLDFRPLGEAIVRWACGAAFYGSARDALRSEVAAHAPGFRTTSAQTMADALAWCWEQSRPGDAILLSPACSSQDQFQNFRRRGEHFVALVRQLAQVDKTADCPPQ